MKKRLWLTIAKNNSGLDTSLLLDTLSKDFDVQLSTYQTKMEVNYKEFLPNKWGLDGIKARLRFVVPKESNNVVLFSYRTDFDKPLHAWTYPNPLTNGDAFVEVPWKPEWNQWASEAALHEVTHAINRVLLWQGTPIKDTLDEHPTNMGGVWENLDRMRPHFHKIPVPPHILTSMGRILALATQLLGLLKQAFTSNSGASVGLPEGNRAPMAEDNTTIPVEPENPVLWVQPHGLVPEVHEKAQELLRKAEANGYVLRITEGYRSPERQNELYAQGRTKPGQVVTNARAGESMHNYRIAFDVVDRYRGYNINWEEIGKMGESVGLEWGGRWVSFVDRPHFELRKGRSLEELKKANI